MVPLTKSSGEYRANAFPRHLAVPLPNCGPRNYFNRGSMMIVHSSTNEHDVCSLGRAVGLITSFLGRITWGLLYPIHHDLVDRYGSTTLSNLRDAFFSSLKKLTSDKYVERALRKLKREHTEPDTNFFVLASNI